MDKLLREIENNIIRIKTRLRYLEAIETELRTLAGSVGYPIKNDIVHRMVIDSYDMVVIDLASLCRGMLAKGGFFNQLNNHLRKLKRPTLKEIEAPKGQILVATPMDDEEYRAFERVVADDYRRTMKEALDETFERLFPPRVPQRSWLGRLFFGDPKPTPVTKVTQNDIDILKDRFEQLVKDVIRDRDSRRAHRYEVRKADAAVERLSLGRLAVEFGKVEQVINDVRALTVGGHFIYEPPTHASPEGTARDIADLVILGSGKQIFRRFGVTDALKSGGSSIQYQWQFRDAFYLNQWRKRLVKTLRKVQQRKTP